MGCNDCELAPDRSHSKDVFQVSVRCNTELLLLHRDNSTTSLHCALLLYFINNAATGAFELGSNTKLNFSPLDRLVFWYQQTNPHRPQRDSLRNNNNNNNNNKAVQHSTTKRRCGLAD